MTASNDTHSKRIGYLLWLVGFTGAHRFYLWTLNDQISERNLATI